MARPGWFDGKAYRAILVVGLGAGCNTFEPPNEQGARLVIPTDTRPAEQPDQPLPPVTGGTLLVTQSGTLAVTAVPELDAVMGVSLSDSRVLWSIPLEPSEVPGRLVEDETGVGSEQRADLGPQPELRVLRIGTLERHHRAQALGALDLLRQFVERGLRLRGDGQAEQAQRADQPQATPRCRNHAGHGTRFASGASGGS